MTDYIDADDLEAEDTAGDWPEEDVELPSGKFAHVRGLNRLEYMQVAKIQQTKGQPAAEAFAVSVGLVSPRKTAEQVAAWQRKARAGADTALDRITRAIARLSGMRPNAENDAYREFEADPGSEFRSLPDAETRVAVGGGDAPGDER